MIKKIIKLLLIVFWMGVIFSFSNDTGKVSTQKSDGFIIRVVQTILNKNLSSEEKEKWTSYFVKPVRKGAHLGVYSVLGILIINFVLEYLAINSKSIFISLFFSFLYACSDEIHQLLIPGRSGQISDVLLDTFGSLIGILLFLLIVRKCFKSEQKERIS